MFFLNDIYQLYHHNTAVITDDGKRITYGELVNSANELYSIINHRCLVFCLSQNSLDSLRGYLSFVQNKVVPLMLDASLNETLLKELIIIYRPEFIWLPLYRLDEFEKFEIIYSSDEYALVRLNIKTVFSLNAKIALLLTTSGSTGSPKLVRLSYDNLQANAESIAQYLSITDKERPITSLPMNYSFGLSIINSHILKGATILLTNRSLMEKEFWAFLKNEKATSLSGVPYTFEILKRLRFFRMDLPSLKTLTQAGGKLQIELNKEFAEYCKATAKHFFVMYGQTEATARMTYLPCEQSLAKIGSIGVAIPKGELSLIDEKGNEFDESDKVGELVYKGPNVSLGYAECGDDLEKGDENEGILITGDLAKKDDDNYYYIVGRKKRFIKLYGNRVNLDETERLLKELVTDCACVGIDDRMVIYVTESDNEEKVRKYISFKTGINQNAFMVTKINVIPKNPSGKTIYSMLEI
jgi:long-chain acyl-CoA synthetase